MQVLQMLKKANTKVFRSLLFTIPARPNLIYQIYDETRTYRPARYTSYVIHLKSCHEIRYSVSRRLLPSSRTVN